MPSRQAHLQLAAFALGLSACTVGGGARHLDGGSHRDGAGTFIDPCTPDSMNATLGRACAADADCQDGCYCNGAESCGSSHTCEAGALPCNDEIACTLDACVEAVDSCAHDPDPTMCSDGDACNGHELCSLTLGCRPSVAPLVCNDDDACTFDSCDSASGCAHVPIDLDGDGEGPLRCGGLDCNDDNAAISSHATEICDNWIDDDCDGQTDTQDDGCPPSYDTCATALHLSGAGRYPGSTFGLALDYQLACRVERSEGADAVFVLTLDAMRDVIVSVQGNDAAVALRDIASCAGGPERACVAALRRAPAIRARGLAPGDYAILVHTLSQGPFELDVSYLDPSEEPAGDVCSTAVAVSAGTGSALEDGLIEDSRTSCASSSSPLWTDAYFWFDLALPQDVTLTAQQDGALLSMNVTSACGDLGTELSCWSGPSPLVRTSTLPAGRFYVTVATQHRGGTIQLAVATSTP